MNVRFSSYRFTRGLPQICILAGMASALAPYPPALRGQSTNPAATPGTQSAAPAQSEAILLGVGKPIEREMRGGETHSYGIHVEAGQFVHMVVLQEGIDVAVSLLDPGGKELIKMDSLNGAYGPEPVSAIADVSGDFQLKVVAGEAAPGRYQVQLADLRAPTQADRTRMEAERVYMAGADLYARGDASSFAAAAGKWQQSFDLWQSLDDKYGQAISLYSLAAALDGTKEYKKALDYFNQAQLLLHAVGDRDGEAATLTNIGAVYSNLGENQKTLDYYNQSLPVYRAVGDRAGEANSRYVVGKVYDALGEKQKALESYELALPILRDTGNRAGEAITLINIGKVYSDLGEKQKALESYNQVLPILRAVGDRAGEARTLSNIGKVYADLGEKQKALDFYTQALPLSRVVGDREGEAATLNNIGAVYSALGEKQKALEYYTQALPLRRAVGDRAGEASALSNIGKVYDDLGEKQKALDYYTQALPLSRVVGDRAGEATTLNNIGLVYSALGEKQKALDYYTQALPLSRVVGDREGEAATLNNIGAVYSALGEKQKALEYYSQVLPLSRAVGDRAGEAATLNNIGAVYSALGEKQKALEYYTQALPLATAVNDPILESGISYNLMVSQRTPQPALAIFYGKQAVNLLQQVRGNIQGLDKELQKSFLASKNDYYRGLADLLIDQGRLPEAQQALDLLKQQEYSDYVRGGAGDTLSPLTLTPAEERAEADYQKSTAQLVSLGEQWARLKKIATRTPEEEKQFRDLSNQLDAASKGLDAFYARLYVLFGKDSAANKQVADVKGDVSALEDQIAETSHTAALYTMVTADHYRVIVITATATVAREYAITGMELNKKVADFEQVLRNPGQDPKPLAQELYTILIGPVKADLDQAKAETLVWSLDGVLRYVPVAALYDGNQYVVENYNTVTITPASIAHLSEKPDVSNLSAAAMGISHQYEAGLPALPAVAVELGDVVKDANVQRANGALPGTILLDGQFTELAMEKQLDGRPNVVHIASHFVFKPGDDSQSYLLLAGKDEAGAGFHLTVADFRDNKNLALRHTDLLTLSACETGMSGSASNGREVDGLGTMAQLKGARAVISSLWSVNDASTGQLMGDFYKRWVDGAGKVTKVEALREAQLDLLLGRVTAAAGADGRGFARAKTGSEAPKGYAHPYYWAPFVLMGNWR
jgi:CHAT domain-containing protein/Tfp pilus assembly protein PilF